MCLKRCLGRTPNIAVVASYLAAKRCLRALEKRPRHSLVFPMVDVITNHLRILDKEYGSW